MTGGNSPPGSVLPVLRSKKEARKLYNRISGVYDGIAGIFERKYTEVALWRLAVQEGERVLEIGSGTGRSLLTIARSVGSGGQAYGIDISPGMLKVTQRKLEKSRLADRVELHCGDALSLPYRDNTLDAVLMSLRQKLQTK